MYHKQYLKDVRDFNLPAIGLALQVHINVENANTEIWHTSLEIDVGELIHHIARSSIANRRWMICLCSRKKLKRQGFLFLCKE